MKSKFVFFISIFAILSLILSALPAQARQGDAAISIPGMLPAGQQQSPPRNCFNLDVLFVVDQSPSMSRDDGSSSNPDFFTSDPKEKRREATDLAIVQLAQHIDTYCQDKQHRVGMISFSKTAEVSLPWRVLKTSSTKSAVDVAIEIKDVKNRRTPQNFKRKNGTAQYRLPSELDSPRDEDDPQKAFDLAIQMFTALSNPTDPKLTNADPLVKQVEPVSATGDRKRIIIFITDGIPCNKDTNCSQDKGSGTYATPYVERLRALLNTNFPFDSTLKKQEECLDRLREQYVDLTSAPPNQVNDCLINNKPTAKAYEDSVYIWMLLIKSYDMVASPDLGQIINLQKLYDGIAKDHMGIGVKVPPDQKSELIIIDRDKGENIVAAFRAIIERLSGVRAMLIECGKSFAVNPYLSRIIVTAENADINNKIILSYTDAKGVLRTITKGKTTGGFTVVKWLGENDTNESYTFDAPYPGLWKIQGTTNCTGIKAYYEAVDLVALPSVTTLRDMLQYDIPPFYDAADKRYIEFKMQDKNKSNNEILQADDDFFAVKPIVTVTTEKGTKTIYEMEWIAAEKKFKSKEPLKVAETGKYTVSLKGTTWKHDGLPVIDGTPPLKDAFPTLQTLFDQSDVSFEVKPVKPFKLVADYPTNNASISPAHSTILSGWPLRPEPLIIKAKVVGRDDKPLNAVEILTDPAKALNATVRTGNESSDTFLACNANGECSGTISNFDAMGTMTLNIKLSSGFKEAYRPDLREIPTLTFTRSDSLWTTPLTYQISGGTLLALSLIILGIVIYSRLNAVTGELIFEVGTSQIASFPLGSGWRTTRISRGMLKAEPTLMLRSLKAWKSSQTGSIDFEAVDDNGNAYNGTLGHGEIFNYTGGMTIRYESLHHSE